MHKTIFLALLICSIAPITFQRTAQDPLANILSGLDIDLDLTNFNAALGEEETAISQNGFDYDAENAAPLILRTFASLMGQLNEEMIFENEFQLGEDEETILVKEEMEVVEILSNDNEELSSANLLLPFEGVEDAVDFVNGLINSNNIDFSSEELALLLSENSEVIIMMEEIFEGKLHSSLTPLVLAAINGLDDQDDSQNAISGISIGAIDGLNGIEGEEEKGEENLELTYSSTHDEFEVLDLQNSNANGSATGYQALIWGLVAFVLVLIIVKGWRSLKKNETTIEEDSNHYVQIRNN